MWLYNEQSSLIFSQVAILAKYNLIVPAQNARSLVASLHAFHRAQEAGFANELVEQSLLLNQFLRSVEFFHLTLVKYDDAIAIEDSVDAMRN